jgi:hypothetical protein
MASSTSVKSKTAQLRQEPGGGIGFDWVRFGFVLGLYWHFIGFNWL